MLLPSAVIRFEKLLIDNSPALLTAIGVVGTVSTAVLTGKASIKAHDILTHGVADWERKHQLEYTTKEKVELTWKLFIPAVGSGLLTATAIIGANRIGTRRAAGLAAAFTLSEKAYSEYKDKVLETLGPKKEQALRDGLAQDKVSRTPGSREVIIVGTDVLCFDAYTGRYFKSSMEALKRAQNDLNVEVLHNNYASLSDLYNLLDIPTTSGSDELGWNLDNLLEMKFSTTMSEDGRPCISVDFQLDSVRDYYKMG